MLEALGWILTGIWGAIRGFFWTITHPAQAFDLSNGEAVFRIVYYGASREFFFLVMLIVVAVFVAGLFRREFLWAVVRGIEATMNTLGRIFAWAGLLMVLQQTAVIFLQSIFRASDIGFGPFGLSFEQPIGWFQDGLKLHNALVVALCCAYTFVQGGHVRVDLFYAAWSHRAKRVADMIGTLLFMIPATVLIWFYGWFYLWRHLVTPNVSATDPLDRMIARARAFRWDVETFAASPSGFNAYFLFKVLIVLFAATMFVTAVGFFYRAFLEWREGEASAGKYLDHDRLTEAEEAAHAGGHQ